MSGTWAAGWATGDVLTEAELGKSGGCFYDSILVGTAASIDITTVPTWGAHLKFILSGRSDSAANFVSVQIRLNNISTSSYYSILGYFTDAAVAQAGDVAAATSGRAGTIAAANAVSGYPGIVEITIPDFRSTTFNKTYQSTSYELHNSGTGNQQIVMHGGVVVSTAAVTRVTLIPTGNFIAGTRCSAYVIGAA